MTLAGGFPQALSSMRMKPDGGLMESPTGCGVSPPGSSATISSPKAGLLQ